MSSNFELEIKNFLDVQGDPILAADHLISMLESSEESLTSENLRVLARFLWRAGLHDRLLNLCSRLLFNDSVALPWEFVIEAVSAHYESQIPEPLQEALLEALKTDSIRAIACRSKALDGILPLMRTDRADQRLRWIKNYRNQKDELIEHLATLRTQQLYEQEKELLARLQKLYPGDDEVKREARDHKERYALDVLSKHRRLSKQLRIEETPDAELEAMKPTLQGSLVANAEIEPELVRDLAVAAAMFDFVETSLTILDGAPADEIESRWLRVELLLTARRYLDLLHELSRLELDFASQPETFFGTAYLRAQALWGLGQKHTAIEVLESLLAARPHYRSGLSLLVLWRGP